MTRLLPFLALLLAGAVQAQTAVTGRVLDDATGEGLPMATIRVADAHHHGGATGDVLGVAADADGRFSLPLPAGSHTLTVSAIGYTPQDVESTTGTVVEVRLRDATTSLAEVVVSGDGPVTGDPAAPPDRRGSTEDLLQRLAGVSLIQRGNFAWEPSIRGQSNGQIGLVIDGMRVYGACVDRMDPASAYVEPENLQRIEVSKGGFDLSQSSQTGGTVNLVTARPDFTRPFAAEVETGVESGAGLFRARGAANVVRGDWAARASASYRGAGDYAAGGGAVVAESGFAKRNYAAALSRRFGSGHTLTAQFIGDDAWLVGYPVLLMDATLAQMRMGSLGYRFNGPRVNGEARVYANRVDHWMDDRDRDVTQREVMRGMYMPMYGWTETLGGLARADGTLGGNQVGLTLEAHHVRQFGDMDMLSVYPQIPDMYLLNVGDARATNGAVSGTAGRTMGRFDLRASGRLDLSTRTLTMPEAVSVFEGRYGTTDLDRQYTIPSASATLGYAVSRMAHVHVSLSSNGRLPTLTENYGHYVYNYTDGYFYTGDPRLRPERSQQAEVGLDVSTPRFALRTALFASHLTSHVGFLADPFIQNGVGTYRFRVFANTGRARLIGGEVSALWAPINGLELATAASYVEGRHLHDENHPAGLYDDHLAEMPPLNGFVAVRYGYGRWRGEAESRWALAQNLVAYNTAGELPTNGFNVLNLRGSYNVGFGVTVKAGVENVLDSFYREHTAVGRLPGRGRNLFVALAATL